MRHKNRNPPREEPPISPTSKDSPRARSYVLVIYPDDPLYYCYQGVLNGYDNVHILHDKDIDLDTGELKKPHYHYYIRFRNARYLSAVAAEIGCPPNILQICRNEKASLRYLCHQDDPEKYQYSPDSVKGTIYGEYLKLTQSDHSEEDDVTVILDYIDAKQNRIIFMRDLIRFALEKGCYSALRRGGWILREAVKEHNESIGAHIFKEYTTAYEIEQELLERTKGIKK